MQPLIGFALVVVGVVAGVASGMFGIGGGVIIVPALTLLLGFNLNQAVGTSLGALLMPVGIFAVLQYHRAGKLRAPVVLPIAIGLIVGGVGGARLALNLPVSTLQQLYGLFLFYAGWRFAEPRKWLAQRRLAVGQAPATDEESKAETGVSWIVLLLLGLGAGVLSGMFGIGGGIVIVPALVGLLNFDQKVAVGTSLGALLLPVGLGGVLEYYNAGQFDLLAAALVAVGLVLGSIVGARIALGLPSQTVKRLYGVFLFFVGLRFLLQGG